MRSTEMHAAGRRAPPLRPGPLGADRCRFKQKACGLASPVNPSSAHHTMQKAATPCRAFACISTRLMCRQAMSLQQPATVLLK